MHEKSSRTTSRWQGFVLSILLLVAPGLSTAAEDSVEIGALYSLSAEQSQRARSEGTADVTVSAQALDALSRRPARATLRDVPLADGTTETFTIDAFDVFTDDAIVYEFDGHTRKFIAFPDVALFMGSGSSDPSTSIVLSVVAGDSMRATVRKDLEVVSVVGPQANGTRHTIAGVQAIERAGMNPHCTGGVASPQGDGRTARRSADGRFGATDDVLEAELLIDAGNALYAGPMGGSSTLTSEYIAQLVGAAAGIYRRDVRVAPKISQLVIWTTLEEFDGADTFEQLENYANYNFVTRGSVPRDLAHYLTTHAGYGGRAFIDALCSGFNGYGVSNPDGSFVFGTAGFVADVNMVAHELGHNFGSVHTHCYEPPIDHCYNAEPGCYSGVVEPSVGETMSYCHQNGSVEMGFRDRVGQVIRSGAELASCLDPKVADCGDGVLDPGEECDDGDADDGDCCSTACLLLSATSAGCEDGNFCTEDYACADSSCYYQPVICEDGNGCTYEYCDDTVDSCLTVDRDGAECDDGFYCTVDDECQGGACGGGTARLCEDIDACTLDSCDELNDTCVYPILPPSNTCSEAGLAQLSMKSTSVDKINWKWGKGPAIDSAEFGNPRTDPANAFSLCFYDETDLLLTSLSAPQHSILWREKNGAFKYKDSPKPDTPALLTGMSLKPGDAGKAKVSAKGKRVNLAFPTLPITATTLRVQLRRNAGPECWQATFVPPYDTNLATEFKDSE